MNRDDYRALFELPEELYFLSHSVGCLPANARKSLSETGLDPWATEGEAWTTWLLHVEGFSEAFGELLGCRPDNLCPQVNLSSALTKIIHSLPTRAERPCLLLSEDDFPSLGFVLKQAERCGYRTRFLPSGCDPGELSVWADALGTDVQLALVTHVQSNNGLQLPVQAIAELCSEREVFCVVDLAQSAGVIPIDLQKWRVDFAVGSCIKWLCGGPGAGFLYASDVMCERCEPVDVGWFSHEQPFEFDIHQFRYAPGAKRFWGGTPSVWPYLVAEPAVRTLLNIGIETIHRHNDRLVERIRRGFDAALLASPAERERRGGTVIVDFGDNAAACAGLRAKGVACDYRDRGVRVSPHIYNTVADVDRLVEVARAVARDA